ncbi:Mitochondrial glycine transporter [Plasmodiophora brassicae]|uniref:Mitochondrial glycine transporter n=1 Tax=Plasmodiophora brassicae TaxID=37360 RepID=A0A0G4J8F1_PLABS|nr:hypothetical protein PBRA_003399 [Plasmodiophora brassicae]SPQ99749.1 unnamed protein product [Plasmodiophora brassicae]
MAGDARGGAVVHVLAGCSSGVVAAAVLQPLDVVKTTVIGTFRSEGLRVPAYSRSFDAATQIVKERGITALWRGVGPSVVRVALGAGFYFGMLNALLVKDERGKATKESAAFAGGFSRLFTATLLSPLTLVKTRFEGAVADHYTGLVDALRSIQRAEGVRGLYSGLLPTLVRDVPYSSVNVLIYTQVKPMFQERIESSIAVSLLTGMISGTTGTVITHPMDVLRTRIQIRESNYASGVWGTFLRVVHEEGPKGLFRGVFPRLIKRGLSNALTWSMYERLAVFYERCLD